MTKLYSANELAKRLLPGGDFDTANAFSISLVSAAEHEAPFACKYCGLPSWIDPSDQSPPPDYCHEIDHGTAEDRAVFGSCPVGS